MKLTQTTVCAPCPCSGLRSKSPEKISTVPIADPIPYLTSVSTDDAEVFKSEDPRTLYSSFVKIGKWCEFLIVLKRKKLIVLSATATLANKLGNLSFLQAKGHMDLFTEL